MIYIKKLVYSLAVLFGIINLLFGLMLGSKPAPDGLSESVIQSVRVSTSIIALGGFLLLIGGISGFLKKNWSKTVVVIGFALAAGGYIYDGNMLFPLIYAAVALFAFLKG